MKKIIPIILIFLSLTSCYSNPKDLEKIEKLESKVLNLESKIEEQDFQKKKICLDYQEKIINDLKELELKSNRGKYLLKEIFYSKSDGNCYFVSVIEENNDSYFENLYKYGDHSYYSESISTCYVYYQDFEKIENGCDELQTKIEELKN